MGLIKEVEKFFANAGIEEAAAEAKLLVTCVSGVSTEEILCGAEIKAADEIWRLAKERAKTGAPIQHIIGFAYFMGDKFKVNGEVLIPRPETELLVRSAIKEIQDIYDAKTGGTMNVLDIGTGTGCVAIEIAKNLPEIQIEIMGTDISTGAIRTAIDNMNFYNLERRVVFRKSDIFNGIREVDKFDVIVSNPPYIPISIKETLQNEVKNFEPHLALFADDDEGVEFYEKILKGAKPHLKQNSRIIFELGAGQAGAVSKIGENLGYKLLYTEKDLIGIERVICFKG